MENYLFFIDPVPASRPRVSKYGTYYLPTYRKFKAAMQELIAKSRDAYTKHEGPLEVSILCSVPKPKTTKREFPNGDVDNYAKAVLDSLNGVLWNDDDDVVSLNASKRYTDSKGFILVEVDNFKPADAKPTRKKRKVSKMCRSGPGHKRRQSSRVRRRA